MSLESSRVVVYSACETPSLAESHWVNLTPVSGSLSAYSSWICGLPASRNGWYAAHSSVPSEGSPYRCYEHQDTAREQVFIGVTYTRFNDIEVKCAYQGSCLLVADLQHLGRVLEIDRELVLVGSCGQPPEVSVRLPTIPGWDLHVEIELVCHGIAVRISVAVL
jgi:hypothetical protein